MILGWDYEYNYDEILHEREHSSKRQWQTEVVSKTIPPEVYEYLKKAKTVDDINSLDGKIRFYNKPYLRLTNPEIKWTGEKCDVIVGIERYVVLNSLLKTKNIRKGFRNYIKEKPLSLIDYWAVDWDYDGITFKSHWQAMRRMGRNIVTTPRSTSKELDAGKLYTIAIRVVDIFGNDASNTVNIDLRNKLTSSQLKQ